MKCACPPSADGVDRRQFDGRRCLTCGLRLWTPSTEIRVGDVFTGVPGYGGRPARVAWVVTSKTAEGWENGEPFQPLCKHGRRLKLRDMHPGVLGVKDCGECALERAEPAGQYLG